MSLSLVEEDEIKTKRERNYKYTDKELLEFLREFYRENGRVPEQLDFVNNSKYPSFNRYIKNFRSWRNAIELAKLNPKESREKDFSNIECSECGSTGLYSTGNAYKKYEGNSFKHDRGIFTEEWLCGKCYWKKRYIKYDKPLTVRRTGSLSYSKMILGDLFEELTSKWRNVEILSKINDNYALPYDHSPDKELGIIQTKGKVLAYLKFPSEGWHFKNNDRLKKYDFEICYCISRDLNTVEQTHIIPSYELYNKAGFTITKNPKRGIPWHEKFRIKDQETLTKVNEIWKQILKEKNKYELEKGAKNSYD
jgi:hypothetical protein